jgi:hypothetical protein
MSKFTKEQLEALKKETTNFEILVFTMMHQFHAQGEEKKSLAATSLYQELVKAKRVLYK